MKKRKLISVLLSTMLLLFSCSVFKDVFVDNYNGAGYFNKLTYNQNGNLATVDSLNPNEGFDAVVFMHLKMAYSCNPSVKPDEIRGFPEIHFALTDAFVSSDPELRDEIRRRGILGRWFKYYVIGKWSDDNQKNDVKYFDSYVIVEVKSKMEVVAIENLYLRFPSDSWLKIVINKNFRVEPDKLNYIGTLNIDLNKTDKYSGNLVQPSYTKYAPGIKEGYLYALHKEIKYDETDFTKDLKFFKLNYPNIYHHFENKIVYFQWN